MEITRRDPFTGKTNTREIDVSEQQIRVWQEGMVIQNAMPHLNADDREFVKTGIMPESWPDE